MSVALTQPERPRRYAESLEDSIGWNRRNRARIVERAAVEANPFNRAFLCGLVQEFDTDYRRLHRERGAVPRRRRSHLTVIKGEKS